MTTHELAKKLLELPDSPAVLEVNVPEWYGGIEVETYQVKSIEFKPCFFTDNNLRYREEPAVLIISNKGWK